MQQHDVTITRTAMSLLTRFTRVCSNFCRVTYLHIHHHDHIYTGAQTAAFPMRTAVYSLVGNANRVWRWIYLFTFCVVVNNAQNCTLSHLILQHVAVLRLNDTRLMSRGRHWTSRCSQRIVRKKKNHQLGSCQLSRDNSSLAIECLSLYREICA